jgi:iron complex outermembrane recepter protein
MNVENQNNRRCANPPRDGLEGLMLPIIDQRVTGFLTVDSPRTKAFIGADCDVGHWLVHGQLTRYGEWSDLSDESAAYNETYGARYLLDASLSYHWSRWMLTVGGNDIINTYPQLVDRLNNFDGLLPYPDSSPFGFSGA